METEWGDIDEAWWEKEENRIKQTNKRTDEQINRKNLQLMEVWWRAQSVEPCCFFLVFFYPSPISCNTWCNQTILLQLCLLSKKIQGFYLAHFPSLRSLHEVWVDADMNLLTQRCCRKSTWAQSRGFRRVNSRWVSGEWKRAKLGAEA